MREDALALQTDDDWESAVMQFQQEMSDVSEGFLDCPLSGCRRALRCVGNRPICMPRCRLELQPGVAQELVEEIYAEIQQERRDAAAENRAPYVKRVMKDRMEDDDIDPSATPADRDLERNMPIAREALRRDDAPPAPQSQLGLRQPVPPAAPPPVAPAANAEPPTPVVTAVPAPPAPWQPNISPETEERINQIWADYVAGKPMPRPEPRIRSLSDDDRAWGVPPWWKGRR
ncbi:MAG TPA: hypothetical protein VGO01_04510 [Bradyrhizobium sp.]|nr:hypothetical protein [Bradyrhizobium sp.]